MLNAFSSAIMFPSDSSQIAQIPQTCLYLVETTLHIDTESFLQMFLYNLW